MGSRKKILAISGSTRADSVNVHILTAIAGMYNADAVITLYTEIDQLPHFNQTSIQVTGQHPLRTFATRSMTQMVC